MFDHAGWTPRPHPTNLPILGQYIDIVPWDAEVHAEQLWDEFGGLKANQHLFHYGWKPMNAWRDFADIMQGFNDSGDFVTCIFAEKEFGRAVGMASYMAIVPENGSVETGCVAHGQSLLRKRGATEAHYLMARRAFDELGYRRYEWKLNNPNKPSHRAARRMGFTFEGVFRQHQVKSYGNRDTAWYSMLDHEWPKCRATFEAWLHPDNFDDAGSQKHTLESFRSGDISTM
ncbi:MAG: GNAT family protein [Pseudomonadota bacterium]